MPTWAARNYELTPGLELPRRTRIEAAADGPAWERRVDELLAIRQLEDDWDGQGSPAPAVEVVDSALVLALLLRKHGVAAPTGVVQGVQGDVLFDWQTPDGKYVEVAVTDAYTADMFVHTPGLPIRRVQLFHSTRDGAAA